MKEAHLQVELRFFFFLPASMIDHIQHKMSYAEPFQPGLYSEVTIKLTKSNGSTHLVLNHSGVPQTDMERTKVTIWIHKYIDTYLDTVS